MQWWEIVLWTLWVFWGCLAGFGLWLMRRMDIDDEFELPEDHWRADREFTVGGYAIIYGWILFSIIWVGWNGIVLVELYNLFG